jgi:hypothetical protein
MLRLTIVLAALGLCAGIASAAPPDPTGRWSGYWISDKNGHHGPLHGNFTRIDDCTYRVRFHGRFAGIIPFAYTSRMQIVGAGDDVVMLAAQRNLGPGLGTFHTTAAATSTSFDAMFSAKGDSGRFIMSRRR